MYSDWFGSTRATPYAWQYVTQYAYTDTNKTTPVDLSNTPRGQRVYIGFQARNIGANTWSNTGSNPVRVGTSNPQNRNSIFCDNTWLSCARPANLQEASVAPGSIGTFEFWYNIPAGGGTYNEYFNILAEGNTWMNDIGLYYHTYTPTPIYTWQLTNQYAYTDANKTTGVDLSNLVPGQRVFIGYQARNTGNVAWNNSIVKSGTSNPRDRISPFCDTSWLSCSRTSALKEASVAPGSIGTFEFWYKAPATPGDYKEHYSVLAEGVIWMNDPDMNFFTRVGVGPRAQGAVETLGANQQLNINQSLISTDNRYRLVMQGDGNLVLYDNQSRAYWSSGTAGRGTSNLVMQNDGNLVVYRAGGNPTWYTQTSGQL